MWSFLSVLSLGLALLKGLQMWIEAEREKLDHKDNARLSEELLIKIKEMDELKVRMNQLLIKNGLGR
jgi:hypothetical protein